MHKHMSEVVLKLLINGYTAIIGDTRYCLSESNKLCIINRDRVINRENLVPIDCDIQKFINMCESISDSDKEAMSAMYVASNRKPIKSVGL